MLKTALAAASLMTLTLHANATTITDSAGDFLPSFVGAQTANRDVISVSASYNNGSFDFGGTFAGPLDQSDGTFYVFGIDRGQGTARFGAIAPGVTFDSVVIVTPGVSTVVRDLLTNIATTLAPGATTLGVNSIDVLVDGSLLPSTGVPIAQYGVNLWPRIGSGNNNQISDFAPNNSDFALTVPEPISIALLGAGLAGVLAARRRQPGPV